MENNKIIRALEICATNGCSLGKCPYKKEENCKIKLVLDANMMIVTVMAQTKAVENEIFKDLKRELRSKMNYQY